MDRIRIILAIILATVAVQQKVIAGEREFLAREYIRDAMELYRKGAYAEAKKLFEQAMQTDENNVKSIYNLGNTLYRQNNYEEAAKVYEDYAAKISDKFLKAKAYHNLGNAYLQQRKIDEAISAYKKALKNNPLDEETRYNLAFAQKLKQQQNQQQNQENQNNDKQDENKNKEEEEKEKEKEEKKQDNKQKDQKDKKDKNNPKDQEGNKEDKKNPEDEKQNGNQSRPNKVDKDQAKKILDALNAAEKKKQKERGNKKDQVVVTGIEKDW